MKGQEPNTRSEWIDNIRAVATIAVIVLHVAAPAVATEYSPKSDNTNWWIANIYDSFCRFCVPAFVMLTGALLLPQDISLNDFLKKRFRRIVFPFLFWSIVYIVFNLALKVRDEGGMAALNNIGSWISIQIVQGAVVHLWYVYMIIGLYLFIPILKPWIQTASNKDIVYFLGIWAVTLIVGQQRFRDLNTHLDFSYFSGYIGYLVLGYFISERMLISRTIRYIASLLFVLGFMVTLAGTFIFTTAKGTFSDDFYDYSTLNVLWASSGAFIIIKSWKSTFHNVIIVNLRDIISRYGFGIYLCHLLILSIMSHFRIDYSLITPLVGIPVTTIMCLFFSCMLIYTLNKLPYGKYVSG